MRVEKKTSRMNRSILDVLNGMDLKVGLPNDAKGLVAKCSETRLAGLTVCCLGGEATP